MVQCGVLWVVVGVEGDWGTCAVFWNAFEAREGCRSGWLGAALLHLNNAIRL